MKSARRWLQRKLRFALVGAASTAFIACWPIAGVSNASVQAVQSSSTAAPSIQVVGNHFVNQAGSTIRLLGVNRPGMDWLGANGACDTSQNSAVPSAMANWGINAVRLPLNEDCWLGINGVSAATMSSYRSGVEQYVGALNASGIYAILDLHRSAPGSTPATAMQAMPDSDHSPVFWSSVAQIFASHPAVIFDLFNEPHLADVIPANANYWACWRNGCTLNVLYTQNGGQTQTLSTTWQAAGMQQLVNAVRNAGARQPIMVEGLNWASNLSASPTGPISWITYEPTDPLGQLVASPHVYPGSSCQTNSCWVQQYAAVAQQVPVVTGELGEGDCSSAFINQYMQFADTYGVSYLAWAWTPQASCVSGGGNYGLISDWSGTPTPVGAALKAHLAGLTTTPPTTTPPTTTPPTTTPPTTTPPTTTPPTTTPPTTTPPTTTPPTTGSSATSYTRPSVAFPTSAGSIGQSTLLITPQHVGDLVVLYVRVFANALSVGMVSGGNVSWQGSATVSVSDVAGNQHLELWWGTAAGTGPATVSVTYSGSVVGVFTILTADSWSSNLGAAGPWSVVNSGNTNQVSGTALTYPALMSATGTNGGIYEGYMWASNSTSPGTLNGFSYYKAPSALKDIEVSGGPLASHTSYAPTASQASSGTAFGVAAIFQAT